MTLRASDLNERVRIEQATSTPDGYGGQSISWTELATVYAQVRPISSNSRERNVGDQATGSAGYRVVMRGRTDVHGSMRIVWKTHVLRIHSIYEDDGALSILTYEDTI